MMNVCTTAVLLSSLMAIVYSGDVPTCAADNVTVTETQLDSGVKELQWIGDKSFSTVVFVTESGGLYKSSNGGTTFTSQLSALNGIQRDGVSEVQATADGNAFWVLGHGKRVWLTTDAGVSYRAVDMPEVIHAVMPSPTFGQYALLETYSDRCFNATAPGACKTSLWVTTDMLNSPAQLITTDSQQYDWGTEGGRIYFSGWETVNSTQHTYQRDRSLIALRYTTETKAPFTLVTIQPRCAGFVQTGGALWAAVTDPAKPLALALMYAGKGGFDPLERLVFPTELDEGRYTIVSADSQALFINVQHQDAQWGNLYVAPSNVSAGKHQFSLSLPRAVRYLDGTIEFARFHGMQGTFIANVLEDEDVTVKSGREPNKLTYITYDNGGEWHSIDPPTGRGASPCGDVFCRLHLHGIRKKRLHRDRFSPTDFGPLHTKPNTIGKAMATGNVGQGLSDTEVGVFFTRDGGHEWSQVANGSYTYDFADHGALMVAAVNNQPTQEVKWSWNEGISWTTCRPTLNASVSLIVANIVGDPASVGERVLLYGVDAATKKGYVVHFDFSTLHERACGPDDYEMWSPASSTGTHCYLGVTKAYKRRLREAECYNEEVLESVASEKQCPCTRDDYACDTCHVQRIGRKMTDTCELDEMCAVNLWGAQAKAMVGAAAPLECKETYNRTRGYVLVAGTRCLLDGGVNLLPETVACPPVTTGVSGGYVALAVISVLIIIGGLIFGFLWWRRKTVGRSVEYGQLATEETSSRKIVSSRIADVLADDAPKPQVGTVPDDFNPRA